MTSESFDALAQLCRLRDGPQKEAARLVLVDGKQQAATARELGILPNALGNTIRVLRRAQKLAAIAAKNC